MEVGPSSWTMEKGHLIGLTSWSMVLTNLEYKGRDIPRDHYDTPKFLENNNHRNIILPLSQNDCSCF